MLYELIKIKRTESNTIQSLAVPRKMILHLESKLVATVLTHITG